MLDEMCILKDGFEQTKVDGQPLVILYCWKGMGSTSRGNKGIEAGEGDIDCTKSVATMVIDSIQRANDSGGWRESEKK